MPTVTAHTPILPTDSLHYKFNYVRM